MRRKPTATGIKYANRWERVSMLGSWALVALAALVCVVAAWMMGSTIKNAPVATMYVAGDLTDMQQQQLYNVLNPVLKSSFYTIDLETLRDAALRLPWLDRVVVTRHWPNGVVVRATPRHPIARWGSGRLLSDSGNIFVEASYVDRRDLPLLHGPITHSKELMQQYRQINQWFAPLGMQLRELHLTDRMTWFMQFNNGIRVIVDQDQTLTKLQRLSQLGLTQLKPVWDNVVAVDLRYRNGMALQWKNAQPPKVVGGSFVIEPPELKLPIVTNVTVTNVTQQRTTP